MAIVRSLAVSLLLLALLTEIALSRPGNISGRAGTNLKFLPLNCNDPFEQATAKALSGYNPMIMLVYNQRLFFFFSKFVIKMPDVTRTYDDYAQLWRRHEFFLNEERFGDADKMLTHSRLEIAYTSNQDNTHFLTHDKKLKHLSNIILGMVDIASESSTFLKSYAPNLLLLLDETEEKKMFLEVSMTANEKFAYTEEAAHKPDFPLKAEDFYRDKNGKSNQMFVKPIFLRKDSVKKFKIEYWGRSVRFVYSYSFTVNEKVNETTIGTTIKNVEASVVRFQHYQVKQAAYYEATDLGYMVPSRSSKKDKNQPWALFSPMVVELDTEFMLHFNRYVFEIRRYQETLRILSHSSHEMTMPEFFSCLDRHTFITRRPTEVKGIVFSERRFPNGSADISTDKTLIFFDYFYVISSLDLVKNEFVFNVPGLKKEFQRIESDLFEKRDKMRPDWADGAKIERLSTKYLKHIQGDKGPLIYFGAGGPTGALNSRDEFRSYEMTVMDDNKLKFVLSSNKAIRCQMNTFNVGQLGYCFERWTYRCMSKDKFKTLHDDNQLGRAYRISDIFRNSEVEWDNEAVELIFDYRNGVYVVFATMNWLYVFPRAKFETLFDGHIIYNGLRTEFWKKHNCLWTNCVDRAVEEELDIDDDPYDDRKRRKREAASPDDPAASWTKDDSTNADFLNDLLAKVLTTRDQRAGD